MCPNAGLVFLRPVLPSFSARSKTFERFLVRSFSFVSSSLFLPSAFLPVTLYGFNQEEGKSDVGRLRRRYDERRSSVDEWEQSPAITSLIGAILFAKFAHEKIFLGTDARDDGQAHRRG